MRACIGFVLVIDSTDTSSMHKLIEFIDQIKHIKGDVFNCVLAVNKVDISDLREVSFAQAQDFAAVHLSQCPVFDVSARTRQNVDEIFTALIREIRCSQDDAISSTSGSDSVMSSPKITRSATVYVQTQTPFQQDKPKRNFFRSISESDHTADMFM
jgi:50S ribosomal subunit-associated GTPase HflX